MFEHLGKWISQWWFLVLAFWVALLVTLQLTAPDWDEVTYDGEYRFIPEEYLSMQGRKLIQEAFPPTTLSQPDISSSQSETPATSIAPASSTVAIIAYRDQSSSATDSSPPNLTNKDFQYLETLFETLVSLWKTKNLPLHEIRSRTRAQPPASLTTLDRVIGQRLTSQSTPDGQATLILITVATEFMENRNIQIVNSIIETVRQQHVQHLIPEGLQFAYAGDAVVGHDILEATNESVSRTHVTTVVLVLSILLFVYRAPILAMIPLITISVATHVSLKFLALLTPLGLQVYKTTDILVVVVLFGVGTDYCLFLLGRFKEECVHSSSNSEAISNTLRHVGETLMASAGTVMCGLGMMWFSNFSKFRFNGIALALSVFIALCAALTLAPALLRILGAFISWPAWLQKQPRNDLWENIAHMVCRHPGAILAVTLLVLLPIAWLGLQPEITYDILSELSSERESVQGNEVIGRFFSLGALNPITILIDSRDQSDPGHQRSQSTQDEIRQLVTELENISWESIHGPGSVTEVRSVVTPLGKTVQTGLIAIAARTLSNRYYVSSQDGYDGQISRIDVVLNQPPFSKSSLEGLKSITRVLERHIQDPESLLHQHKYALSGITAGMADLQEVTRQDQWRVDMLVVLGIFVILFILLRRLGVCLYLVATVLLGYFVTLGVTEIAFRTVLGPDFDGLDWKLPIFLFTILVAVGEDYNIFLISRIKEEQTRHGPVAGIHKALTQTGGIISSCGVIMAGTFFALMSGSLTAMLQLGFALGFGILLDTFVVRPIMVPAFILLIDRTQISSMMSNSAEAPSSPEATTDHS